jgi:replicative DNA helicase
MAKSVARLTFQRMREAGDDRFCAKTTRGILSGKRYEHYLPAELAMIGAAQEEYARLGEHIWFTEGIGDVSTQMIRERALRHMAMTGRPPVVIVDYLQIMMPVDLRATDKQNTDRNVLEMKRLSRDLNIPVIGISSLNRENYLQPINLTAFKEAGSIEYGSDCLIGLQYEGMDYQEGEAEKAREKRVRELLRRNEGLARDGSAVMIQLKILKNRNGSRGSSTPLLYSPMFNHFEEMAEADSAARSADPFGGAASVPLRG